VGVLHVFLRSRRDEFVLYRARRVAGCQTGAVGNTEYVCINRNFGLAEHHVQDDACGLAPDARQCLQCLAVVGYLASVLIDDLLCEPNEVLGLRVVKATVLRYGSHPRRPVLRSRQGCLRPGNSLRVAALTLLSVVCADSMTAASSSKGVSWSSSVVGLGFAA